MIWLSRVLAASMLAVQVIAVSYGLASLVGPGSELIPDRPTLVAALAFTLTFFAFPAVGAVIAWNRPTHPIGWVFIVIGWGLAVSTFGAEYAGRAVFVGDDLPFAAMVAWIGGWSWIVAGGLAMTFVPLLFPTGRPPSPRWQPFGWVAGLSIGLVLVSEAIRPGPLEGYRGVLDNPVGIGGMVGEAAAVISGAAFMVLCTVGAVSVASLVVRYRRSRGPERQQIKWLLYPVALFVCGLTAAAISQAEPAWTLSLLALGAMPVGAGIAILRHRLLDIDLLINRTVVYGALTVTLGGLYVGLVIGLQALLAGFTGGNSLAVAASTLTVAAMFRLIRRRIQAAVDRRFYRSRYDAAQTLDAFTARLRQEVDLGRLIDELGDSVERSLRPASTSVWIRPRR